MTGKGLTATELGAAIERIAASAAFGRAGRAVQLLRYLGAMKQSGRDNEVKEYTLALEVFGRSEYDPKVDSVVRVEAGRLRSLLAKYYENEGALDTVRISVPKGRYTLEVTTGSSGAAETRRPARWWMAAAAVLLLLAAGYGATRMRSERKTPRPAHNPAIAVLPFVDMSLTKDQQSWADGLTEEITNELASGDGMVVASRTSAFAYQNRNVDVRRVGEELKLHAVLEGSVRVQDKQVRVTVQFINARNGFHIWSETYDQRLDDPLQVQRKIAKAVAAYLQLDLPATRRALTQPPTQNEQAWQNYLRAIRLSEQPMPNSESIEHFEAAVTADPGYAPAWAGLSHFLSVLYEWGYEPAPRLARAADAASRAVEADGSLVEAHEALGRVKVLRERDWTGAEAAFRRAIEIDPLHIDSRFGYARLVLVLQGRFDEAIDQLKKATALDSTRYEVHTELAAAYVRSGQWDLAEETLARSRVKGAPSVLVWQGVLAAARGKQAEAIQLLERAAQRNPGRWTSGHLGYALAAGGQVERARELLGQLESTPQAEFERAVIHCGLGERDAALALLEKAVDGQVSATMWLKSDYRLASLRQDPRFAVVLRKAGFV